ncbi:MAG: hypothetical protein AUG51_26470 [Acidobacteria bacterium 13_1_20CM_3_53_8]|nr:MAG: hypothetical protein AUG51_26470 [Acidobacteria bacterium 13_1_20CM_3_53_8]
MVSPYCSATAEKSTTRQAYLTSEKRLEYSKVRNKEQDIRGEPAPTINLQRTLLLVKVRKVRMHRSFHNFETSQSDYFHFVSIF